MALNRSAIRPWLGHPATARIVKTPVESVNMSRRIVIGLRN
jgi:hypothetical protein